MTNKRFEVWKTIGSFQCWHIEDIINDKVICDHIMHKYEADRLCSCLNELHDEKQSVIDWIDRKIEEIKPYNSELCRATLLELKEFLE